MYPKLVKIEPYNTRLVVLTTTKFALENTPDIPRKEIIILRDVFDIEGLYSASRKSSDRFSYNPLAVGLFHVLLFKIHFY